MQQAFLRGSEGLQLTHLVPEGHACSWPGRELGAGKDLKERKVRKDGLLKASTIDFPRKTLENGWQNICLYIYIYIHVYVYMDAYICLAFFSLDLVMALLI